MWSTFSAMSCVHLVVLILLWCIRLVSLLLANLCTAHEVPARGNLFSAGVEWGLAVGICRLASFQPVYCVGDEVKFYKASSGAEVVLCLCAWLVSIIQYLHRCG